MFHLLIIFAHLNSCLTSCNHGRQSTLRSRLDLAPPIRCLADCWFSSRHLDHYSGVSLGYVAVVSLTFTALIPASPEEWSLHYRIAYWSENGVVASRRIISMTNHLLVSFIPKPFEPLAPILKQINDFLEKLITWPREVGQAILTCQPTFPAPSVSM